MSLRCVPNDVRSIAFSMRSSTILMTHTWSMLATRTSPSGGKPSPDGWSSSQNEVAAPCSSTRQIRPPSWSDSHSVPSCQRGPSGNLRLGMLMSAMARSASDEGWPGALVKGTGSGPQEVIVAQHLVPQHPHVGVFRYLAGAGGSGQLRPGLLEGVGGVAEHGGDVVALELGEAAPGEVELLQVLDRPGQPFGPLGRQGVGDARHDGGERPEDLVVQRMPLG